MGVYPFQTSMDMWASMEKLDDPVVLDWQELRARDISGRARAFQSMVGGGMDIAKAAALSGLMMD